MIGETIRKLRKERDLTMIQLAELSGLSQAQISRIETGDSNFSVESLEALAQALDVPIKELFDESDGHETNVAAYDAGLGDLIREAREAKGWSQEQLGKAVGVTRAAVSRWEIDDNVPTRKRAPKVAEVLEISLGAISPYGEFPASAAAEDGRKSNVSAFDVGQRVAQLRRLQMMDQIPFGEKAGISQSRLSSYETGARMLTVQAALALCDTYRVTMDWLYRGDTYGLPHWMHQKLKE